MKFQISDQLKKRIEIYFKNYIDFKNKLLSGDVNAIGQLGIESQKNINPNDVIEAYESNNMDYLYKQAKKMVELQKIYKELSDAYALGNAHSEGNSLEKRK